MNWDLSTRPEQRRPYQQYLLDVLLLPQYYY